jgi:hypothetical protein
MSESTLTHVMVSEIHDPTRYKVYQFGGAAILLACLVTLLDTSLSFLPVGLTPDPGKGTAVDWFTLLQKDWFLGVRGLGFFNIIGSILMAPVFVVLYTAIRQGAVHRQPSRIYAALAVILLGIGATLYIVNNPAFPMLRLSDQYTAAASEADKASLAAAGQAILAQSEDFTPGSFPGFLFNEVAGILMAAAMLRSGLFSKLTVWSGMLGFTCLLIFTIWATFVPVFYDAAMMIAVVGGLLNMTWFILVACRLFRLGRRY